MAWLQLLDLFYHLLVSWHAPAIIFSSLPKMEDFNPGFLPAQVDCNDLSIVQVADAGDRFRMTGMEAGWTQCGFTSIVLPSDRRVITVLVKP